MSVLIEMSDTLLRAMRLPEEEAPARLKRELAVRLYAKRLLGFGKAREFAGLNAWEFSELLGAEGVTRSYGDDDLADDMKTLENIG
jgi:predicted HTH domain antitoxin